MCSGRMLMYTLLSVVSLAAILLSAGLPNLIHTASLTLAGVGYDCGRYDGGKTPPGLKIHRNPPPFPSRVPANALPATASSPSRQPWPLFLSPGDTSPGDREPNLTPSCLQFWSVTSSRVPALWTTQMTAPLLSTRSAARTTSTLPAPSATRPRRKSERLRPPLS